MRHEGQSAGHTLQCFEWKTMNFPWLTAGKTWQNEGMPDTQTLNLSSSSLAQVSR